MKEQGAGSSLTVTAALDGMEEHAEENGVWGQQEPQGQELAGRPRGRGGGLQHHDSEAGGDQWN